MFVHACVFLCSFMRVDMCVSFMRVYFVFIHACVYLWSFMRVYICVHSCVYICVKIDRLTEEVESRLYESVGGGSVRGVLGFG